MEANNNSLEVVKMKNKYTISFDFTVKEDIKYLGNLCEQAIHNKNPKWNIFHIEITNIEQLEKLYDENDLINDLY